MTGERAPRAAPIRRAPWITFEGIEGTGKSTQLERLAARLRDPRATRSSRRASPAARRSAARCATCCSAAPAPALDPLTELLLYAADRAQHVSEVVLPALARGTLVLCDRYVDATLAYQGYGRGLGVALVRDAAPASSARPAAGPHGPARPRTGPGARARARAGRQDRARHSRGAVRGRAARRSTSASVRAISRSRPSEPARIRVVDARGGVEQVARRVAAELVDLVPELGSAP